MSKLVYPKAMLFTEQGTVIVQPVHDPDICGQEKSKRVNCRCQGCRFLYLFEEMLSLHIPELAGQGGVEEGRADGTH